VGDLALWVGDDGEGELRAGNLVNILDPGLVGLGAVGALYRIRTNPHSHNWALTYETDQLDATSSELGLELGESTELSGANGSEVILNKTPLAYALPTAVLENLQWCMVTHGVGEEDSPAVANVVVELDRTVGGVGLEVGGSRAETEAERQRCVS
jgi:hypothetical protein